jgi:hypothetical protein
MEWRESREQAGACDMELTQPEADVLVRAVVDYNLERLDGGDNVDPAHESVLRHISGERQARLSPYDAIGIERLAVALLRYSQKTPAELDRLRTSYLVYAELETGLSRCDAGNLALGLYNGMMSVKRTLEDDAAA